jgi:hypothetical protein
MGPLTADAVVEYQTPPHFIYITGCDGVGKTTQTRLLLAQLQKQRIKARHLWLRFPFLFSAPLLTFARGRGYSWSEVHQGVRHGYWDFRRSWMMRCVFPWVLLLDATIAAVWKVYLPLGLGWTIVCERFVLDMLIDLAVAYDDTSFFARLPGKWYVRLLPTNIHTVILDLDTETIRQRRPDLRSDYSLAQRLIGFQSLAMRLALPIVCNDDSIAVAASKIKAIIES